jgi:hypothetical protein
MNPADDRAGADATGGLRRLLMMASASLVRRMAAGSPTEQDLRDLDILAGASGPTQLRRCRPATIRQSPRAFAWPRAAPTKMNNPYDRGDRLRLKARTARRDASVTPTP